jgi:hypothetical protein
MSLSDFELKLIVTATDWSNLEAPGKDAGKDGDAAGDEARNYVPQARYVCTWQCDRETRAKMSNGRHEIC